MMKMRHKAKAFGIARGSCRSTPSSDWDKPEGIMRVNQT